MVIWKTLVLTAIAAPVIGFAAMAEEAQQGSLKRATLQTGEFPPGYETVMIVAQMEPGKCSGWHTHPGLESSYFLEGEVLIHFAGKLYLSVKGRFAVLIEAAPPHNDCD